MIHRPTPADRRQGCLKTCFGVTLGCLGLIGFGAVLVGWMVWQVGRQDGMRLGLPPELGQGGAFRGAGTLREETFYTDPALGEPLLLARGELDPQPGPEIAVVGQKRVLFLDDAGRVKARVSVAADDCWAAPVRLLHVAGQPGCLFVEGGSGAANVRAHDGRVLWHTPPIRRVTAVATGDLDGRGTDALVVSFRHGGIARYDLAGHQLWQVDPRDLSQLTWDQREQPAVGELGIAQRFGRPCIVYSRLSRWGLLNPNGDELQVNSDRNFTRRFAVCPFPTRELPSCLVGVTRGPGDASELQVRTLEAAALLKGSLPVVGNTRRLNATLVRFWPDRPEYLAVAVLQIYFKSGGGRSPRWCLVFVYDRQGRLVYATAHDGTQPTLAAVPRPDGKGERLLVGSQGKVLALSAP